MKRYIFLDIDGVLNSDMWYDHLIDIKDNWEVLPGHPDWYGYYHLDPEAVQLLNQLSPSVIIISSTWRFTIDTINRLRYRGLTLDIIDGTEHFHKDWLIRGNEIQKYICEQIATDQSFEYVIFDDDCDMLPQQMDNFIHVDRYVGLTQSHIDRAKKILKID